MTDAGAQRCDKCKWWKIKEYGNDDRHAEDKHGDCHRHAPDPLPAAFVHELLKHLTTVSWHFADEQQKDWDFDSWEEPLDETVSWPVTSSSDFCGEFQPK